MLPIRETDLIYNHLLIPELDNVYLKEYLEKEKDVIEKIFLNSPNRAKIAQDLGYDIDVEVEE